MRVGPLLSTLTPTRRKVEDPENGSCWDGMRRERERFSGIDVGEEGGEENADDFQFSYFQDPKPEEGRTASVIMIFFMPQTASDYRHHPF